MKTSVSNAMEEVRLARATAGLAQRKARARDCVTQFSKSNCLSVKYNTQTQLSVLPKKLPLEHCETHEIF